MTDLLAPDADQLTVQVLLASPDITALVGVNGAYTIIPQDVDFEAGVLRVTQIDTIAVAQRWFDGNIVQVDAWATRRSRASLIGRTARAVINDLAGSQPRGVVNGATTSGWRYEPDTEFPKAMPRYLFTAVIYAHPNPVLGS